MRTDGFASLSSALQPTWSVRLNSEPSVKVQDGKKASDTNPDGDGRHPYKERPAKPEVAVSSGRLVIELDKAAGVFVQRLIDPLSADVLRQYPSESALMLARAQRAYEKALANADEPASR